MTTQRQDSLAHFSPMSHFYTLWKRQKTIIEQKFKSFNEFIIFEQKQFIE